jgi:hypothetical protein
MMAMDLMSVRLGMALGLWNTSGATKFPSLQIGERVEQGVPRSRPLKTPERKPVPI